MEEIDKITALIEKLNLNQTYMGRLEEEDTQGIIYGIDSDDENPEMKMADDDEVINPNPGKRPRSPSPSIQIGQASIGGWLESTGKLMV